MKEKIAELRRKMEGYLGTARNVVDKALHEQRSLTEAEKSDVEGLKGKAAAVKETLDLYGEVRDLQEEASKPLTIPQKPGPVGTASVRSVDPGEVRAFTPKENIADYIRSREGGEQERLSLGKAVRGMLLGDWRGAENERRSMAEATGSLGGWLVGSSLSGMVIDMARNKSACIRAGARTIPMEEPELTVVKITSGPTAYWRAEHSEITESDMGFEPVKMKAVALGCLCRVSLELLEDARAFSQTVEDAISSALALELDRAGLLGSGVGEPRGLWNTDGVQVYSMGANGGAFNDYDPFSRAVEYVANVNGTASAVVYSPRTRGALDRLKDNTGQPLNPPESFRSLLKFASNQVPNDQVQGTATNASAAFVGDFSQLLFGIRTQLVLEATRTGGTDTFSKMQALIRGYLRADVAVLRPNHFVNLKGITA